MGFLCTCCFSSIKNKPCIYCEEEYEYSIYRYYTKRKFTIQNILLYKMMQECHSEMQLRNNGMFRYY